MTGHAVQYPEILEELRAIVAATLVDKGIDTGAADGASHEVVQRVRKAWGGGNIYIPRGVSMDVEMLRREVQARWNGTNTRELSHELGITERRLRQLAAEAANLSLGF